MRQHPPYWYWHLDRWNLLIAAALAVLALALALRIGGSAPPVAVPATAEPAAGSQLQPTAGVPVATARPTASVPTLGFAGGQTALLTGKPFVATGTAEPGARVELFDGDALLGETTAGADGAWTLNAPGLSAGAHSLVVRATGADGVSVESTPLIVTVVLPAPTLAPAPPPAIVAPPGGLAPVAGVPGPELSGTAAPGAKVEIYDGDELIGETTAGPDGVWRFLLPALSAGSHDLVVRETAPDGMVTESAPLTVEVAPAPPAIVAPPGGLAPVAGVPGPELSGTAAPGAKVEIYDGDELIGETTAGPDGVWRLPLPALSAGSHDLVVRETAPDGTVTESAPLTVEVAPAPTETPTPAATAAPTPAPPGIAAPPGGLALVAGMPGPELSGTAAPGAKVEIYDGDVLIGETTAGPDGSWRFVLPGLAEGSHTLIARVTAPDGVVTESRPVRVEVAPAAPPAIAVPPVGLAPVAGAPGPELSGTAAPGAKVQIYDGDELIGETTAGPDGVWRFPLPALAAGSHTLIARVTGPDGTVTESKPVIVEVAPAPPAIVVPPGGLALVADTPGAELAGTAAPGAKVEIYDGDVLIGETTAGPDGAWRFPLPALAAGSHTLIVKETAPDGTVTEGEPLRVEVAARPVGLENYPQPYLVSLPAKGSVNVPAAGYCLNYGLPFPGATLQLSDALPDALRKGLAYAVHQGYTVRDPAQTQLAVWYLAEGKQVPGRTYTIADEIIRFAQGEAPAPELGQSLQTLIQAVRSGSVSVALTGFTNLQPRSVAYSGRGTLVITNLTDQAQDFLIPYGVRFSDATATGVQDMAVFPAAK